MPSSETLSTHNCPISPQASLSNFIEDVTFPCVGAKSALNKDRMRFADYSAMGSPRDARDLCDRLIEFSDEFPDPGSTPVSLIAMFRNPLPSEKKFEAELWNHLQLMHDHDSRRFEWDESVESDPASSEFSFSIGGRAFFVVGLHPAASRQSRQTPFPCLVFNFHDQFESLKASGKYQSMQTVIRARDIELQGSVNPVLARFGTASEARQYSGRAVGADWQCPFQAKVAVHE